MSTNYSIVTEGTIREGILKEMNELLPPDQNDMVTEGTIRLGILKAVS